MSRQLLLGAVFFVTFTAQTAWAGVMLVERSFLSGGDRLKHEIRSCDVSD